MPFTKIKYNPDKAGVELEWQNTAKSDTTESRLTSPDKPLPAFVDAMQAFRMYVMHICRFGDGFDVDLTVVGVSISHSESQGRGLVVTALKKLAATQAPLVINTPHLPEVAEHGPTLPAFALELLDEMERQANRYRDRERMQRDAFAGDAADAEADDFGKNVSKVTISTAGRSVSMTGAEFSRAAKRITKGTQARAPQ